MSSRATTLQVSRVNCRKPLPSAPSTSASGCCNAHRAEILAALAVEANGHEAAVVQLVQRAGEILHGHQWHQLQRAGGRLRQHPGRFGAVTRRGDDGLDREGRRRAQDGADIVRIGDLVEHQHDALLRQRHRYQASPAARPPPAGPDARRRGRAVRRSGSAARFPGSRGGRSCRRPAAWRRFRSATACESGAAGWPTPPQRYASHKE